MHNHVTLYEHYRTKSVIACLLFICIPGESTVRNCFVLLLLLWEKQNKWDIRLSLFHVLWFLIYSLKIGLNVGMFKTRVQFVNYHAPSRDCAIDRSWSALKLCSAGFKKHCCRWSGSFLIKCFQDTNCYCSLGKERLEICKYWQQ
jgi:hypothetical protein